MPGADHLSVRDSWLIVVACWPALATVTQQGHVITNVRSLTHMASHRTTLPLCDGFASLCFPHRKRRGAPSGSAGSERIEALRYQRVKKNKKVGINNNNSKTRQKTGERQVTIDVLYVCCVKYKVSFLIQISFV